MFSLAPRAGATVGDNEVMILADASRAQKQLAALNFCSSCPAYIHGVDGGRGF